jgi:hypothetical protein
MELQLGTLVVASNVPANTACEPGGFGFLNFFDFATGFSPAGSTARSGFRVTGLTVGLSIVRLPDGSVVVYRQKHTGEPPGKEAVPINIGQPSGKRLTWRELSRDPWRQWPAEDRLRSPAGLVRGRARGRSPRMRRPSTCRSSRFRRRCAWALWCGCRCMPQWCRAVGGAGRSRRSGRIARRPYYRRARADAAGGTRRRAGAETSPSS